MQATRSSRPILAVLFIVLLGAGGCSKSPEEKKAAQAAEAARTHGSLVVHTNLANAVISLAPADGSSPPRTIAPRQQIDGLLPGRYNLVGQHDGWPDVQGDANVSVGTVTEIPLQFPSGSLKVVTEPAGASVRPAKGAEFGKTPLTVAALPAGGFPLALVYQDWPVVTEKVVITEGQETSLAVRLPHGRLVLESVPAGAAVLLDGKPRGKTPAGIDAVPAGKHKLVLQHKDFPPLETTITIVDKEELRLNSALGSALPELDPAAFLRAVWVDDRTKVAATFNSVTGVYRPKNDIVKNLHRERFYHNWQRQSFRHAGPVKSYDADSGRLEFAEQKSELSRYRVVAFLPPGTPSPVPVPKNAKSPISLAVYGKFTAAEEPAWPSRVITLELEDAAFLPTDPTP